MGLPIARYIAGRYSGDVNLAAIPSRGYTTEMMVKLKGVVETAVRKAILKEFGDTRPQGDRPR